MRHLFRIVLDVPDPLLNIFITAVALITRRGILRKEGNFMVVQKYRKLTGLLPRIVHKDFRLVPYQIGTIKHNSPVMESSKTLNLKVV